MRYKPITIAAPDADLSDVLVRIKIDADADIGSVCQDNGFDVYFTMSDGSVRLPFSRLQWSIVNGKASGLFDVLCDVPVSGKTIFIAYGGVAATDSQSREQAYRNYLAVYPCDAIFDGNKIEDVSGNGKHITIPSGMTVSVYASERCGKMLRRTDGNSNLGTQSVGMDYDGDLSVSCVTDSVSRSDDYEMLPSPSGWFNNGVWLIRYVNNTVRIYTYSGMSGVMVAIGSWIDYANYVIPLATGTRVASGYGSNGLISASYEKTWTRPNYSTIFPSGNSGYGQSRDVRYRKGSVSAAFKKFERNSLHHQVASVGSEIHTKAKRRRHNTILEAF